MKNSTGMKIINYGLKIYGEQELLLFQSEGSFFFSNLRCSCLFELTEIEKKERSHVAKRNNE